ncbi:trypsin-like serine protease [Pseudoalteromonas aurantia]|uniref:Serine protease n=1 Tax=Pseudoalteromonas aurantia TaxID=43654 RepID=A0ABY2VT45_9GAMM|nr:trypsin-like serine protease [Pseudoalteromonas aurantia]TMO59826.1 serine protease [Pseudoalteromonas aurantia]TMO70980.1 serine protease [Pseudoalteromonas aurantia]
MKMTLSALAILSSLASMSTSASAVDVSPNIVGGTETPAYSRPYQVALLMNGRQGCGGTLLSREWVLTAAHCLDTASTSNLTVKVGAHSLSQNDGQVLRVSQIINHEQWRGANGIRSGYDIALLKLASPAEAKYTPAKLPTAEIERQYASVGNSVTVSGWGLTSNRGRPSDRLLEVALPVISNANCSSQLNYNIPNSVICGGGQGGKSACNGDSGGPYAVRVGNDFYSMGTVSWGIGCSGATAFTRTTSYLNWIQNKTGLLDPIDAPPVADFDVQVNQFTAQFTDRSSDDTSIIAHYWQFGDSQGGTSTNANPTYQFPQAGTYTVSLTVTDSAQQTHTTAQSIQIGTATPCNGVTPWSATIAYALGDKVSYQGFEYEATWWSQGAAPDRYSQVWKKGQACSDITDPAPTADFSVTTLGLVATFTNLSRDNGQITQTNWLFGDGTSSNAFSPTHSYRANGSYQVSLSVTDDQGQVSQFTKTVIVSSGDNTNCNGIQPWSSEQIYLAGDQVTVGNMIYRANWWVQGENPTASGPWGAWQANGTCQ